MGWILVHWFTKVVVTGRGVLPGKLGVGVRQASENPSAIKTNIGDFPYVFYDQTKNLIPCLLCSVQTRFVISPLGQTSVQDNVSLFLPS